jgi:RNA polymerase sigma-70 factor (ECF subfamily)
LLQDSDLGKRAAAGDAAAFSALVRANEAAVRRFLSRLLRGQGADDLAQEAFITAWRMRGQYRGGSYGAWLMRIAWTRFLSERRSDTRRMERDHAAWEGRAEAYGVSTEMRIDVAEALGGLDERERAAAMLCFAEGYSHSEAAEIMSLPLGTLKSILARARARLATLLEDGHD